MSVVNVVCLPGRRLCDELLTRPEESYRPCCVVMCDLEMSRMRRALPLLGGNATAGGAGWLGIIITVTPSNVNSHVTHVAVITCSVVQQSLSHPKYEGWNFNFGNAAVTFDTAHLQSSYFHRPSMYSPKLCKTRSQR